MRPFYAGKITKNIDIYTPMEHNTINKRQTKKRE